MKIEQIKANAIIKLEFSTGFVLRLQDLVVSYQETFDPKTLKAIFKKIQHDEELTPLESNLETLLILVNDLEKAARVQGFVEVVDIEEPSMAAM